MKTTEDKPKFTVKDVYPTSTRYQPLRDSDLRIIETSEKYVSRMRNSILPKWPNELLTEWLYRHAESIEKYTFLQFESFTFARGRWKLADIPGRESFDKESFCDDFCSIKERAHDGHDWLANYMLREGTWNTPVVILDNTFAQHRFPDGKLMKAPYHLLEGHRRLSFLVGLRKLRRANPEHDIWVVTAPLVAVTKSKKKKAVNASSLVSRRGQFCTRDRKAVDRSILNPCGGNSVTSPGTSPNATRAARVGQLLGGVESRLSVAFDCFGQVVNDRKVIR